MMLGEKILDGKAASLPTDGSGNFIVLSVARDKMEQAVLKCIDTNFELLKELLWAYQFKAPDDRDLEKFIINIDQKRNISGINSSKRASQAWSFQQAHKIHFLMSYVIRLCRRTPNTSHVKLGQLKLMYGRVRREEPAAMQESALSLETLQDLSPPAEKLTPAVLGALSQPTASALGEVVVLDSSSEDDTGSKEKTYEAKHADISTGNAESVRPAALSKTVAMAKALAPIVKASGSKKGESETEGAVSEGEEGKDKTPAKRKSKAQKRENKDSVKRAKGKGGKSIVEPYRVRRMKDSRWIVLHKPPDGPQRQVLNLQDCQFGGEERGRTFADMFVKMFAKGDQKKEVDQAKRELLKGQTVTVEGVSFKI